MPRKKLSVILASSAATKADGLLEELRSTYMKLAKILPDDIKRQEEKIKAKEQEKADKISALENEISAEKQKLKQLQMAMKGLPDMWSLEPQKPTTDKATNIMSIGQKIREFRTQKNWSQYTLAKKANTNQTVISEIERGKKAPDEALVSKLTHELGVKKSDLSATFN